jgi:hypothetical protein
MSANRMSPRCSYSPRRRAQWGLALAASLLITASACRQQAKPPATAPETQPAAPTASAPQTAPAEEPPASEPVAQTQPAERPRRFEISEIGPLKPDRKLRADQPLAILAKSNPRKPARLTAILQSDSLMSIDAENVQALRLDLLALPREEGGRLVVHIDGQGIEITGKKNQIIYLRRSSVGEWSFGRP